MAWFRVQLTEDERRIVNEERTSHPDSGSQQDADNLAPPLRGDSPEGCGNRWRVARYSAAIRGRVLQRRIRRAKAFERPKSR